MVKFIRRGDYFMNYSTKNLTNYMENLLKIASPTGYTENVLNYITEQLDLLKAPYIVTNKGAVIVSLIGKNEDYERTFSAHIDTLGAMVKEIKSNGTLGITLIGGYMCNAIEGENCTVLTLDDKKIGRASCRER